MKAFFRETAKALCLVALKGGKSIYKPKEAGVQLK
jgi:hypothetical protein